MGQPTVLPLAMLLDLPHEAFLILRGEPGPALIAFRFHGPSSAVSFGWWPNLKRWPWELVIEGLIRNYATFEEAREALRRDVRPETEA